MTIKDIIIFDLDGTLALVDHRRHLVEGKNKDFTAFNAACVDDLPNLPIIAINQAMYQTHITWIFSGRHEKHYDETVLWLKENGVRWNYLKMRPADKHSMPDKDLKREWLHEHGIKDRVLFMIDDRQRVVNMWREEGLTCLQVAPGNF